MYVTVTPRVIGSNGMYLSKASVGRSYHACIHFVVLLVCLHLALQFVPGSAFGASERLIAEFDRSKVNDDGRYYNCRCRTVTWDKLGQ